MPSHRTANLNGLVPTLVVFDLDGTVLHLTDAENSAFIGSLEKMAGGPINTDWSSYHARTDLGVARAALSRAWGRKCSDDELNDFLSRYLLQLDEVLLSSSFIPKFVTGAEATIAVLSRRRHVATALATANVRAAAERRLLRAGLRSAFDIRAFADDGPTKTEILQAALARAKSGTHKRSFEQIIFIGDQPSDAAAAWANQVEFLGVASTQRGMQKLRNAGCERFIRNLSLEGRLYEHLHALRVLD